MLRGFRWFALAAVIGTAVLVGPAAARADDCNGAAQSIYSEGCPPTAKGPSHPKPHKTPPASTTTPRVVTPPVVTPPVVTPPVVHVSRGAKHAVLVVAGAVKRLQNLLWKPNHVNARRIHPALASAPMKESSLGSAFDLGTGPMVLFALLFGTVLFLLGTGGVRSWRNRHRV